MSIYDKRKKRKYDEGASTRERFVDRHRELIIFVLILIIVGGGVAAVNAYELRQNAKLINRSNQTGDVSYYAGGAGNDADGSTGTDAVNAAAGNAGSVNEGNGGETSEGTVSEGTSAVNTDNYPDLSQSEVTWNGKQYKRNTYIKP